MESVICTENLSKHYGKLKAVDRVSINVRKGEVYGFLGLNGAGKTTTIRMLLGLIGPTSGEAYLNGVKISPGNTEMWKDVGYLVEVPYSYPDLTVRENLDIIRRLRLMNDLKSVDEIIQLLKLDRYINVAAKNLSLGNAQRLGLAKALIHNPGILLLDEPANGLDPEGIVEIRELLTDLALNNGVTIFISSHILGEISKLATRIGIIHEGRLLHESSIQEMEALRRHCLQVRANNSAGAVEILTKHGYNLSNTEGEILEITGTEAILNPDKVATLMVNSGCPPTLLNVVEEDLETFFLRIIRLKGGAK
ncbi:MAG: bacitracin ABC transporter ATP-binding protein [Bacteroidetes bacterium RBG_13_42_15]|nr:MAG: bacitracin ABC transporter ATP-binding protein [Bacteroidetes bacterium RBG_13_42_15]